MATLALSRIGQLIEPYYAGGSDEMLRQLSLYLDLLVKWNALTNLTAIRDPEEIVSRHFGESLFLASHLPSGAATLLDLGSGAGFPGLPVQLARPELAVTVAESQRKKSAFLREAARVLELRTEVWAGRVEEMPEERRFEVVALRAVDHPELAMWLARKKLALGGTLALLTSGAGVEGNSVRVPGSEHGWLQLVQV